MDVFGVHTHNQVIVSEGVAWCAALSPDWVPGYYWVPLGTSWVPTGYRLGTWVPGYLGTWVPTGYHWVLLGTCRFPVSHRSHWVPLGTTGYAGYLGTWVPGYLQQG